MVREERKWNHAQHSMPEKAEIWEKKGTKNSITNRKQIDTNPTISIINLNGNDLNIPI